MENVRIGCCMIKPAIEVTEGIEALVSRASTRTREALRNLARPEPDDMAANRSRSGRVSEA